MANKPINREVVIAPTGGPSYGKGMSQGQAAGCNGHFALDLIAFDRILAGLARRLRLFPGLSRI
jgi:hypothetical protein